MRKLKNTRAVAVRVLADIIISGRSLDTALARMDQHLASNIDSRDRGHVQELVYGSVRWYLYLDAICGELLERPLKKKDQDLRLLILVGLYQLVYLSTKAHAAVGETVAATSDLGKPWAKGLVNACLRNFLRNQQAIVDGIDAADPELRYSHPQWLLNELRTSWPAHWREIVEANNQRPPMHLRINLQKISRETCLERLASAGIEAVPLDTPCGIGLRRPVSVEELPGFAAGELSVQDLSAQYAALLLDPQPEERLIDACAAPGGKACHLLELGGADTSLVAVELDRIRAERIEQNLQRLQLRADIRIADAADTDTWWNDDPADRILLDAPCSATGVIRRHPDIKLHRRPEDIEQLVEVQARLLAALWPLLRQGGKLLYATCSVIKHENEHQIRHFLDQHPDAREIAISVPGGVTCEHGVQLFPGEGDGFYYCLLEKI